MSESPPLPAATPLPILYQDAELVVVNKPVGLASIPESKDDPGCVQARLAAQLGARLWVVHRLDKEVSGILVFARTALAHQRLCLAFEHRLVDKRYLGWVWGTPAAASGECSAPIREFGSGRMGVDAVKGKSALTRYRVLQAGEPYCLLELELHTGRRHQLRVHCWHLGHPLVGDTRYGERAKQAAFPRLFLHATSLQVPGLPRFEAPWTERPG